MTRRLATCGLVCTLTLTAAAADWPQFRGPAGTGVAAKSDAGELPAEWAADKNLAWKVKLPGAGWSQPIVSGGTVFVTTAVSDPPLAPKNMMAGVMEPQSRGAGKGLKAPEVTIEWKLLALDLQTGATKWAKTVVSGAPKFPIHPSNTYATETPATDGKLVYSYFGATGTVAAHDFAGKEVWKAELGVGPTTNGFGTGASPALHDGKLYVQLHFDDAASLVCLSAATGKEIWNVKREKGATSWASPLVWVNAVRTEVVSCGRGLVTSHDPATGAELWRVGGLDSSFSSSPACTPEMLVFGSSGPGTIAPLYGVKAGAKGDCTLAKGETANETVAWWKKGVGPGMASPIGLGDYVYVLNNAGLTCYDARTGKEVYKERLPKARTVAASPFAADGKLYFLDESGTAVVVKAGPQFEVLGGGKLDDTFWASPTPAGNGLLLRGVEALYYIKQ